MNKRGRPRHPDILTPAEWRIVELARHGLSTSGIAAWLGISRDGVKFHARNAAGKLGLTGRAALRHYVGGRRGSLLASQQTEGNMQLGPVSQLARQVESLERARLFLGKTLGLRELFTFPPLAFFDLDGLRLMIRETGKREAADIIYFEVPDILAAHADLSKRGVTFTGAPHMIHRHADGTEEWMAFFHDDEGRELALHMRARP